MVLLFPPPRKVVAGRVTNGDPARRVAALGRLQVPGLDVPVAVRVQGRPGLEVALGVGVATSDDGRSRRDSTSST